MSVVAKFVINETAQTQYGGRVKASPVGGENDPRVTKKDEDEAFWNATPQGSIELVITNPGALEQFQCGDTFYVTFDRADT
jgi:hypothetical protein